MQPISISARSARACINTLPSVSRLHRTPSRPLQVSNHHQPFTNSLASQCLLRASTNVPETSNLKTMVALAAAAIAAATALQTSEAYADATVASSTASTNPIATAPSLFEPPILSKTPSLLEKVADADPNAIRQLSQQFFSLPDQSPAMDRETVSALVRGLLVTVDGTPSSGPVQLTILRLLADASQHASPSSFVNAGVPTALSLVLKGITEASAEPWTHWVRRQVGLTTSNSLPQTTQDNQTLDLLSLTPQTVQVDLDGGIAFHALRLAANMSRHTFLHPELLKSPLLTQLCGLITHLHNYPDYFQHNSSHHFLDIVRSTVIAVSALSKSEPQQIVSSSAHLPLIHFMSQRNDLTLQSYAAGGIRNLARHPADKSQKDAWNIHRQLVLSNVCDALSTSLHPDSSPKTKVFAMFAFSDLMTSQHPKAHLIQKRLEPSFSSYVQRVKDPNILVFRTFCHSLVSLLDDPTTSQDIRSIPDTLISLVAEECGPLLTAAFKKHDIFALKAANALCRCESAVQRLVDKGALEYIISELNRAKGEYWKECTVMLTRLSGTHQHRHLISNRGALRMIMSRPFLEDDGRWVAATLANMARDEEHLMAIAHGGLRVLLMAASSKDINAVREGTRGLYNLTLGGVSKIIVEQGGALLPLVKAATSADAETKRLAVGALAEISESLHLATTMIEADLVSALLSCAKADPSLERDVARCFAQFSQVTEVHGSLVKSGAVDWVVDMVEKNGGRGRDSADVMHYCTIAVCNVASSPGIARSCLTDRGMTQTLSAIATGFNTSIIVYNAKQALGNLRGSQKAAAWSADGSVKKGQPR